MKDILLKTSWNDTGEKMYDLIEYFLNKKLLEKAEYSSDLNEIVTTPIHKKEKFEMQKNVVIGAGPTGLSAAYHLDEETILLDKNPTVGGWCRSIQDNGFTFDYAGHIMFSNDSYVQELYKILLNNNVHWQDREAWIFSKGVYTRYPFQGALYGLPPKVIKECLIGAMEARYGVGTESDTNSIEQNLLSIELLNEVQDCCADGTISFVCESAAAKNKNKTENFEEFIYRIWGRGIAKHFAIPYNRKLWKVPLTEMETSWLGGRVPLPNLEEMIEGALEPIPKPMGPNARFGYPLQGGFQSLMDGFLPFIKGEIALNTAVVSLSPSSHSLTLSNGRLIHYKNVISTMPLPELIRCIGSEVPEEIKNAARALRYVSVKCVNLGIGRENISDKHWIYFPEETIFHRIFVQGNASPYNNPRGGFGLTCEITYSNTFPLAYEGQELIDHCIQDCITAGLLTPNDKVITSNLVDMPYAYVVYDHERAANVKIIREWLLDKNIILAGRYSEWEYYNSDHAFVAGKNAADLIKVDAKKKKSYVN
jgi:protoporphyrinogen oxidase